MRLIAVCILSTLAFGDPTRTGRCDVERFFKSVSYPPGAVVLTYGGDIEDIDDLLVPTKVDPGSYSVSVTRKALNLYRVEGYDLYIKTQLCLELALGQDATLKVQEYGGELIFN